MWYVCNIIQICCTHVYFKDTPVPFDRRSSHPVPVRDVASWDWGSWEASQNFGTVDGYSMLFLGILTQSSGQLWVWPRVLTSSSRHFEGLPHTPLDEAIPTWTRGGKNCIRQGTRLKRLVVQYVLGNSASEEAGPFWRGIGSGKFNLCPEMQKPCKIS